MLLISCYPAPWPDVHNPDDDVGDIGVRVDTVRLARLNDTVDGGGALAAYAQTGELPVPSTGLDPRGRREIQFEKRGGCCQRFGKYL